LPGSLGTDFSQATQAMHAWLDPSSRRELLAAR
jgi:hypothetical protein